ncbi:decaprenyl-phosphate phosphoribosyltransferase [Vibrio cyclitrophicus]
MVNISFFLSIFRLMRPKQWVKNLFVLAPLIFSGYFLEMNSIVDAFIAFSLFCMASSATYVLNDYIDVAANQRHPVKSKTRPIAAGEVTKRQARSLMIVLYGLVVFMGYFYPDLTLVIICYLIVNILYTFYLKHKPVLDIFTISFGFVLRVYAGAVAINVPLSNWMFVTTLSLALFLGSIKRRQELLNHGSNSRTVLEKYNLALVDKYASMAATSSLLFYSLYVLSSNPDMVITIPFVLFGFYHYWYLVETMSKGESPTDVLLKDKILRITIVCWTVSCIYCIVK